MHTLRCPVKDCDEKFEIPQRSTESEMDEVKNDFLVHLWESHKISEVGRTVFAYAINLLQQEMVRELEQTRE